MSKWEAIARRIRVPVGFAFAGLYLFLARPMWRSMAIGAILVLIGLAIRAFASGHVRKNEALSTSGPYAYTRNPLYLGSLFIGIGFVVAARSVWVGLVLVAMFYAIYLPVIQGEEVFLRRKFPEFDEYARQVPRMLPTPKAFWRTPNPGGAIFSLDLYRKHREYQALMGAAAMMGALALKLMLMGRG